MSCSRRVRHRRPNSSSCAVELVEASRAQRCVRSCGAPVGVQRCTDTVTSWIQSQPLTDAELRLRPTPASPGAAGRVSVNRPLRLLRRSA